MSNDIVKIVKAEWDLVSKTKFLRVEGHVIVDSFNDKAVASIAELQGINPKILLIEITVKPSGGPMKPQPSPFHLSEVTIGNELWTHVQVAYREEADTMPIHKWAQPSSSKKPDAPVGLMGCADRISDPSTPDGSPAPPPTPPTTGGWGGGHGDH